MREVLREGLAKEIVILGRPAVADIRREPHTLLADAALDHLVEAGERPTTDEQNVRRVDGEELLMRMLTTTLRRH